MFAGIRLGLPLTALHLVALLPTMAVFEAASGVPAPSVQAWRGDTLGTTLRLAPWLLLVSVTCLAPVTLWISARLSQGFVLLLSPLIGAMPAFIATLVGWLGALYAPPLGPAIFVAFPALAIGVCVSPLGVSLWMLLRALRRALRRQTDGSTTPAAFESGSS